MKKLKMVFASASAGKIAEIKYLIDKKLDGIEVELLSLKDVGFTDEIVEDGGTFEANAEIKARAVFEKTGLICFGDDSGLCVDYLDGGPGVDSAMYGSVAGERPDMDISIDKLLGELEGVPEDKRGAHFCCVIYCVVSESESFCVTGRCDGSITRERFGKGGFGYDPVFSYAPAGKTFAQMTDGEKNKVSHRALALELFAENIVRYV